MIEIVEKKPLKLNLGCGQSRLDGFIGVDAVKTDCADVVMDLEEYPWPWEKASVETVLLIHVLEHIKEPVPFLNELYRVMAPEGRILVVGPHAQSSGCWQDPTHRRGINEKFFLYLSKKHRESEGMKVGHYPLNCDFEIDGDLQYQLDGEWRGKARHEQEFAIKHYNNVIIQFLVRLRTVK